MTQLQAFFAFYETTKTTTHEAVFVSVHGVLSLKVVWTGKGHSVPSVYSGFDIPGWSEFESDDAGEPIVPPAQGRTTKFVTAMTRATSKWGGSQTEVFGSLTDILADLHNRNEPTYSAISVASLSDEQVKARLEMLTGDRKAVSSNPKAEAKHKVHVANKFETNLNRMASDPSWGMF